MPTSMNGKHLWELGFDKNVVHFFVPLWGFKKPVLREARQVLYPLVLNWFTHSVISSSEWPICIIAWPHLLSRASHSTRSASWHQKRKREEIQSGQSGVLAFALSLVTRQSSSSMVFWLVAASLVSVGGEEGLLWLPQAQSPASYRDKALGGH